MSDFLFQYRELEPTTWVYLSSLLMIGLFFKFGRCWSVRNLDLLLLVLLAPGMLLIDDGQELQRAAIESRDAAIAAAGQETSTDRSAPGAGAAVADTDADETEWADQQIRGQRREVLGFVWLFGAGGLLLVRLLLDPMMVRRPLLEPNLSLGGLAFIGCALFVFLMANVVSEPADSNDPLAERVSDGIARVAPVPTQGPGYALLSSLPPNWSKSLSILAHLSIVIAMSLVGYRHFGNLVMGIGTATLYLMLPYTSLMTGRIDHVLPAALLVWAVLMYRRPMASGALIGAASGIVYYPFFLLPLWMGFYWQRGFWRFVTGVLPTLAALAAVLILSPNSLAVDLQRMFGLWTPVVSGLRGIWNPDAGGLHGEYRLPVLVAFVALSISLAIWPAQKNLGTVLSCSAAIMVATQFWHGYGGGTYMAWYLPLTLLTIFRPNLEDRVALSVLGDSWLPRLKAA